MAVIGYFNGRWVDPAEPCVPLDERGHQFGDGVYEVIRAYGGRPFLLDWHVERLFQSMEALSIRPPFHPDECQSLIHELLQRSGESEAAIYLQVTRGSAVRNHLFPESSVKANVSGTVRPVPAGQAPHAPGRLLLLPDERWFNPWIKSLNLLPNVLAKQTAHDAGADEALLVRDGCMIEAASSNVWFVLHGELVTAPADRYILAGITRRFVLDLARDLGIPVREAKLPRDRLAEVDAIFLTGTLTEVYPVGSVVEHPDIPCEPVSAERPRVVPVSPSDVREVWTARDMALVEQLRNAFGERVRAWAGALA
ncbi:aminotransferase class IV [Alicyclobacillus vulcanalis]|uniref:D-alanine transaminase n=1 Tax=Alicyclobacillus vulcanalis TaxID=252246 RepID=A0A1N7LXW0_9BACL|nr:aminotransferase class IV [Alicyclobacillus vulcanalis]SIS78642.1 D-alanine transaminase [Alicyclobacillus vulcanalis]